ncbi:MAG: Rv3235 family protein [Propionibacteriaceae bacterium]|jgi:hypothetical protein|nr:Rv3235 family protein [Propionibacteriaceae bacterium]
MTIALPGPFFDPDWRSSHPLPKWLQPKLPLVKEPDPPAPKCREDLFARQCRHVIQLTMEALTGQRPLSQLGKWFPRSLLQWLDSNGREVHIQGLQLNQIKYQRNSASVVELTAHLKHPRPGHRSRSVTVGARLCLQYDGWKCTSLDIMRSGFRRPHLRWPSC